MSSKHFFNDPDELVIGGLRAATLTNPALAFDETHKIVYHTPRIDQVALISGGGSGHEPSFAGLVGHGLLSAAVAGTIFASPSTAQIQNAILERVDGRQGVLVIIMNYTGDVLHFGMAVEKARASGLTVEMLIVGDDVGVGRKQSGKVGRRGLAGTVLVHKIAGAMAARGDGLQEIRRIAQSVIDNLVTVGVSLDHVHVPGRALPSSNDKERLLTGEVEIGMGIHNEPGSSIVKAELPKLVEKMLTQLLDLCDKDRAFVDFKGKNDVALMINNLGGVSPLEIGGITAEVIKQLKIRYDLQPVRVYSGPFMTSLNGMGFSITLLKLGEKEHRSTRRLVDLLDDPAEATGWSAPVTAKTWDNPHKKVSKPMSNNNDSIQSSHLKMDPRQAKNALTVGLNKLVEAEADITRYDTVVGDGDCGIGLKRGAEAILEHLRTTGASDDVVVQVSRVARVIEQSMDGTSGALYTIFVNALVQALVEASPLMETQINLQIWSRVLEASIERLSQYTPAHVGDRTLMDALLPFVETLKISENIKDATEAARRGAESTRGMPASLGRAVYVGGTGYKEVPDPGAFGLSIFLSGLGEGL